MPSDKLGPTAFLKSLGETGDEVAASLRRLGVKGRTTHTGAFCPIAVAINEHANGWGGIMVRSNGYVTYEDCQIMDPQTTPAVKEFVEAFDKGRYPDLRRADR